MWFATIILTDAQYPQAQRVSCGYNVRTLSMVFLRPLLDCKAGLCSLPDTFLTELSLLSVVNWLTFGHITISGYG